MKLSVVLVSVSFLLSMSACSSCDDDDPPAIDAPVSVDVAIVVDASIDAPIDAPFTCDPMNGNGGCGAGKKCAWTLLGDAPETGELRCVPDGSGAGGDACTRGAPGDAGYDNCKAGLACVGGRCVDTCTPGPASVCPSASSCVRYDGLFANAGVDATVGVCQPSCNPVTQTRSSNNMPCGTGLGCYIVATQIDSVAVCASTGTTAHNVDLFDTPFANSCVPGAQPRKKDQTSTTLQCGGLCNANDVTTSGGSEGGLEIAGNATAKDNCQTSWGANPPGDGVAGEGCRYWGSREPFVGLGPLSNTVGFCFKHAVFQFDSNGDQTPDMPFPRCTTLTTGDVVPPIGNPPHNDALYFWCAAAPATLTGNFPQAPSNEPVVSRLTGWR